MKQIHYAYQVCDKKSYQSKPRICGDDRTMLSKKSIVSFFLAVKYCQAKLPEYKHNVNLIYDELTDDLFNFIKKVKYSFSNTSVNIIITPVLKSGIAESIADCYRWLEENGKDFIFQLQDDYLFQESTLYETINIYNKIKEETGSECIVSPYNDSWLWNALYRNVPTPRAVFVGESRYWIQYYDMSCSFFTSHSQFTSHYDLYNKFFQLIPIAIETDGKLESKSLNHILTKRGVLGIVPIPSLSFHLQTELDEDPHQDWKTLWNSIDIS